VTDIHYLLTVKFIRKGLAEVINFMDWRKSFDIFVAIWFKENRRTY